MRRRAPRGRTSFYVMPYIEGETLLFAFVRPQGGAHHLQMRLLLHAFDSDTGEHGTR